MTYQAILTASVFLLLAFGIEKLSKATGVPAVIVLIATGFAARPLLSASGLALEGLDVVVPIIGSIGLVLIVLEGALDIQLRRDRLRAAAGAIAMAGVGFLVCVVVFSLAAFFMLSLTLVQSLVVAVPFAVISSAVAIPSSTFLPPHGREFVIYESSVSDILGVLVFFSLLNSDGTAKGILLGLIGGGFLSLLLAAVFAVGLVLLLMRFDGHIRFIPVLAGLFGLYSLGKLFHLSPLILVLLFGLALNNSQLLTGIRPFHRWFDSSYEATLSEFKVLTLELTFVLLGYWTDLSELASYQSWLVALFLLSVVFGGRYLLLRLSRNALALPLTWLAPRGLITVLLFLEAKQALTLPEYLNGAVMLVVLISASLIAVGRIHSVPEEHGQASSA